MTSKVHAVSVNETFVKNFGVTRKRKIRKWCADRDVPVPNAMDAKVKRALKGEKVEFVFENEDVAMAFVMQFC